MLENGYYSDTTLPKSYLMRKNDIDAIFYSPKELEKPKKCLLITRSISAVKFCEY